MNSDAIPQVGRPRKSVKLSEAELQAYKKYRKKFDTGYECAQAIGIDQNVMARVLLAGSGSPVTIEKIRKVLQ